MKNKYKKILYITYTDTEKLESGSSVRPYKMYKAFLEKGFDVKILSGIASKKNKKKRLQNIREIEQWLNNNKPEYCYIESPSDPIIFKEDRKLIEKIHKKNIKIGYFYRDAYYKLGKNYIFQNQTFTLKKYIRYLYYKFLFWRDELFLMKNIDIAYFPSESMAKYFKFKDKRALPPAGERVNYVRKNAEDLIYVGGISERYGINYLLEAMEIVNETQTIKLNLVCRKSEMNNISAKYLNCKWLNIFNVSGEKLKEIYENSKIALIALKPDIYNNFAVSVKLFEYMSYGLPIVAINSFETKKLIEKYNIGLIAEPDSSEFAQVILKLYNDRKLYEKLEKNIKKASEENLWISRVEKIERELCGL